MNIRELFIFQLKSLIRLKSAGSTQKSEAQHFFFREIDPYRSCFIGLDHLLTGSSRAILTQLLRSISRSNRKLFQKRSVGLLRDLSLSKQDQLFNIETGDISPMPFSQLFDVMCVTPTILQVMNRGKN